MVHAADIYEQVRVLSGTDDVAAGAIGTLVHLDAGCAIVEVERPDDEPALVMLSPDRLERVRGDGTLAA